MKNEGQEQSSPRRSSHAVTTPGIMRPGAVVGSRSLYGAVVKSGHEFALTAGCSNGFKAVSKRLESSALDTVNYIFGNRLNIIHFASPVDVIENIQVVLPGHLLSSISSA